MQKASGISYFDSGSADSAPGRCPLILIHGAGGSALHWPTEVRRLQGHWVLAVDLPGHGKSEGESPATIEGYVECLKNWLDALAIERAVWVGHSMGGGISLTAALSIPERVAGLVLVGTGGRLRVHPLILESTAQPEAFLGAVDLIVKWAFSSSAPSSLTQLVAKRMAETQPKVLHNDFKACDGFDLMSRLEDVLAPAIAICGRDDKLTPPKYSGHLAQQIPDARLKLIDDAGHMVMLEKPVEVAQAIQSFTSQLMAKD